jgi:translation initiation factor IF-3
MKLIERVGEDLEPMATVEASPKFEGRQVTMVLAPRKKKK